MYSYQKVNYPHYSTKNVYNTHKSYNPYNNPEEFVEFPHGGNEYSQYFRSSSRGRITDTFISRQPVHHVPRLTQTVEEYEGYDEFQRPGRVRKTLRNINEPQKFHKSGIIRETQNYRLYERKYWSELNKKPIVETNFEPYPEVKEEVHIVRSTKKSYEPEQEPNYIRKKEYLNRGRSNVDDVRNYLREKEDNNVIYEGDDLNTGIKRNKKIIRTTEIRTSNVKNYDVDKINKSIDMKGQEYITTTKKRVKKRSIEVNQDN